jgi:transposase-like protein
MPKPNSSDAFTVLPVEVSAPPRRRRVFTAAYKIRIVREASQCEFGQVGALLRREGIYDSQLAKWRQILEEHGENGLEGRRRGRKVTTDPSADRIALLEKRISRLQKDLTLAHKVIELQKKVSEILGIQLETLDPEDKS